MKKVASSLSQWLCGVAREVLSEHERRGLPRTVGIGFRGVTVAPDMAPAEAAKMYGTPFIMGKTVALVPDEPKTMLFQMRCRCRLLEAYTHGLDGIYATRLQHNSTLLSFDGPTPLSEAMLQHVLPQQFESTGALILEVVWLA